MRPAAASVRAVNPPLDVVTVPDFRPGAAALFEARTLFFLASWLQRPRAQCSLGLACIGEPPASVRRLGARCGAEITRHEPLRLNQGLTANKLRGFDAPAHGSRLLLLDADTLIVGDLGGLLEAVPAAAMAASPAGNARVPDADWETIYDALGLPRPVERILSIRAELGLRARVPMYPYYNSGVLLLPRAVGLAEWWGRDVATIGGLGNPRAALTASDQAGLATALHRWRLAGVPFVRLPEAYHVCPPHLAGGALPFGEVRVFHAVGFLRGLETREGVEAAMEAYIGRLGAEMRVAAEAEKAAAYLRELWEQHVRPAMEG